MKVALVVQRYGADINGGAELHARYVAEHLARHVEVEVLTTCASDYITWRNERPAGVEHVHGIAVRRFPVARERDPKEFADWSTRVFTTPHSVADELAWLDAEGPTSPALIEHIGTHSDAYDFFIFFSVRYYHSFHGARAVAGKAILVPTAERDGALGLGIFGPIFRGVRGIMYNSFEERALIHGVAGNQDVPGVVVGVGSEIPDRPNAARFRQKHGIRDRFAIYVGRIDENKGCAELFSFFEHYSSALLDGLHLVLIGTPVIPIPDHPKIHHLGFVSDEDKFDAIAASELLIMPSYFESLSMVALEAWALGRPVLANAACDVLQGQCLRSNGGLFYQGFREFFETLRTIDSNAGLAATLGRNGQRFFETHYSWPVIEGKYIDMLERLKAGSAARAMEPLPGWWARRRRTLPPADEVVRRLPTGANRDVEAPTSRPARLTGGADASARPVSTRTDRDTRRVGREPRAADATPAATPDTTAVPAPEPGGTAHPRPRGGRDSRPRGDRGRREGRPADRRPREPQAGSPRAAEPPVTNGAASEARQGRRRPSRGRRRPTGDR